MIISLDLGRARGIVVSEDDWKPGRKHWYVGTAIALCGLLIATVTLFNHYYESDDENRAEATTLAAASPENPDGWGPERETFTMKNPATYAVLNSITDNPQYGDERNFTRVRKSGSSDNYGDLVRAEIGEVATVLAYVGNNCSDNLAGPAATIHGLWAQFQNKQVGTDLWFQILIGGNNATSVYNGASVLTVKPARLSVVGGTAMMYTASSPTGFRLDSELIDGAGKVPLGQDKPDGEFPVGRSSDGQIGYGTGYFTFDVRVEEL